MTKNFFRYKILFYSISSEKDHLYQSKDVYSMLAKSILCLAPKAKIEECDLTSSFLSDSPHLPLPLVQFSSTSHNSSVSNETLLREGIPVITDVLEGNEQSVAFASSR